MLLEKNIEWQLQNARNKAGAFYKNVVESVHLDAATLAKIPESWRPTGPVLRGVIKSYNYQPYSNVSAAIFIKKLLEG